LEEILDHAKESAPIEACGLLAGAGSTVKKSYQLTNVDNSPDHFKLDPKEQFAVAKDMRADGLTVLAVYHSHPATPARMSDEDIALAFTPGIQYVVVSLKDSQAPEVRSFTVQDGRPVEEPVLIGKLEE
jgi:proteasome lid subunit RPN8/RPN11